MDTLAGMVSVFFANLRGIDPVYAGVIALFFGLLTTRIIGVFVLPAVAAAVYIAAQAILPSLFGHAPVVALDFDKDMVELAITLYFVFLVANTTVFAIKSALGTVPQ